jgi:hypothetical protein
MNTHAQSLPSSPFLSPSPAACPSPRSLDLAAARAGRDRLAVLLRHEQGAMADFLVALADFDQHRGWEALGFPSLFAFLHAGLRLSSGATYWRLSAARLLQRLPQVLEPLRDGRLCLSTTAELAKVLTEENLELVLPRYFGLSAREASKVTAELVPREDFPTRTVVTGPAPAPRAVSLAVVPTAPTERSAAVSSTSESVLTSETRSILPIRDAAPRVDLEPYTAELSRLHVTVSRSLMKKLEDAREGLANALPGASDSQVLEAALDLLLEKQARARGLVKKPRRMAPATAPSTTLTATSAAAAISSKNPNAAPTPTAFANAAPTSSPDSAPETAPETAPDTTEPLHRRTGPREHIPAEVRRAVWERDGGACTWPLDGGGRCGSIHRLQFDHVVPWARGSLPTVGELRLLCAAHNRLSARQAFGARCVDRYAGGWSRKGRPR